MLNAFWMLKKKNVLVYTNLTEEKTNVLHKTCTCMLHDFDIIVHVIIHVHVIK